VTCRTHEWEGIDDRGTSDDGRRGDGKKGQRDEEMGVEERKMHD
jgi:hypothetical protein